MNWASSEAVGALVFLLPGFVAAAVFYSLTSHPRPGAFGQVALALIFTGFVQVATWAILLPFDGFGAAAEDASREMPRLALSLAAAVVMALAFARGANNDGVHGLLRKLGFTRETSYASEWYSTFSRHDDCWVVLHLEDRIRLYGWPEEWPSRPDRGHFRISDAIWLTDSESWPAAGVAAILIPVGRVETVEFLPRELPAKQEE